MKEWNVKTLWSRYAPLAAHLNEKGGAKGPKDSCLPSAEIVS